MALNNGPNPGPNNVPSYQMSGIPFVVTGTTGPGGPTEINFPFVTRNVYVKSRGSSLGVSFALSGSLSTTMFTLEDNESWQQELRTTQLFVTGVGGAIKYEIIAGLTFVKRGDFPVLSASNGFLGIG